MDNQIKIEPTDLELSTNSVFISHEGNENETGNDNIKIKAESFVDFIGNNEEHAENDVKTVSNHVDTIKFKNEIDSNNSKLSENENVWGFFEEETVEESNDDEYKKTSESVYCIKMLNNEVNEEHIIKKEIDESNNALRQPPRRRRRNIEKKPIQNICKECNMLFVSFNHLDMHLRRFHSVSRLRNRIDQIRVVNKFKTNVLQLIGSTFDCQFCDKKFSTKACLNKHTKRYHLGQAITPLKCEFCPVLFTNELYKQMHVNVFHLENLSQIS